MVADGWYLEMAAAIKRRDHAANMINSWTAKLAELEQEIETLRIGRTETVRQETEESGSGIS